MKAFVKIMPLIKLKSTLTNLAVVREGQIYKNILELPSEHLPNLRLLRKLKSVRACIEPRSIQNNLTISFCQPTAIVILIKLFAYKMYFKTYFRFEWTRSKGTDVKCANHNARKKKGREDHWAKSYLLLIGWENGTTITRPFQRCRPSKKLITNRERMHRKALSTKSHLLVSGRENGAKLQDTQLKTPFVKVNLNQTNTNRSRINCFFPRTVMCFDSPLFKLNYWTI